MNNNKLPSENKKEKTSRRKYIIMIIVSVIISASILGIISFVSKQYVGTQQPISIQFVCTNNFLQTAFKNPREIIIDLNMTEEQLKHPTFSDISYDINHTGIGFIIHMVDDTHYKVETKLGNMTIPISDFKCQSSYIGWSQVQ